jgi:hypothetical protein
MFEIRELPRLSQRVADVDVASVEGDRVRRQMLADHTECPDLAMPTRATITAIAMVNVMYRSRHHHGVIHRTGWTMTARADQRFAWVTPNGHTLHSQRHRGKPPDP